MNRRWAEAHIHQLAASGNVFLKEHAKRRNPSAGKMPLTIVEITFVLEKGRITEGPAEDIELEDGWKFTMTRMRGAHTYIVSGVLVPKEMVVVITGFEDKSAMLVRRTPRRGGIGGDGRDTE